MAEGSTDPADARPRPRPGPGGPSEAEVVASNGRVVTLPDQTSELVSTAGAALVTAARVGRLLGRSGWRVARQLPGVAEAEKRGRKFGRAAAAEMLRLLEPPRSGSVVPNGPNGPSAEEQRAARLAAQASRDPAPLRTAMTELLSRSAQASGAQSREYLFGTIVSQLVPDEARILAALGSGRTFAVVDVVAKTRSTSRTVLRNVSDVGSAAGVSLPDDVSTYLTRLDGYGLLQYGRDHGDFGKQYRQLETDKQVRDAQSGVERGRGTPKIVRRTVRLSELGREFWAACAPRR